MEKFNAKSEAQKIIAAHMEKLEVPDSTKLRATHKVSQQDATLLYAHLLMQKADITERLTRTKKKNKQLEAVKETESTK